MLNRLTSILLLISGLTLLYLGYEKYQGLSSTLGRALSNDLPLTAIYLLALGAAATVVGGMQTAKTLK